MYLVQLSMSISSIHLQLRLHEASLFSWARQHDLRALHVSVQGPALERFSQMTNWDYYEAARRFQKVPPPPPLPPVLHVHMEECTCVCALPDIATAAHFDDIMHSRFLCHVSCLGAEDRASARCTV